MLRGSVLLNSSSTTMTAGTLTTAMPTLPPTTREAVVRLPSTSVPLDYAEVYARGYPRILAYIRRELARGAHGDVNPDRCGDGKEPSDLAQDVWLAVWRHWATLQWQSLDALWAYAYRAATNAVTDLYRRRRSATRNGQRRLTTETWDIALDTLTDTALDDQPEAVALAREAHAELLALVTATSATRPTRSGVAPTRDVALFEALLADEPLAVTAARLNLNIGQVKMSRLRLRARLRTQLSGVEGDEADEADDEADDGADDEAEAQAV